MTWDKVLKALAAIAGAFAGLIVAAMHRSPKTDGGGLSSKVGFIGLARKGFMILIVLLATLLDRAVGNSTMVFQTTMVFYYIANEGLSILENANLMGVPFPTFLRERPESMREEKQKPPDPEEPGDG